MQRFAILILAAAVAVGAARAQAAQPWSSAAPESAAALTPEAAVELALANNLALARSRVDLAAAERALSRAWNGAAPGITLSAGARRSSATEAVTLSGSAGVSVTLAPRTLHEVRKARASRDVQSLAYETAARSLELEVRKSFYSLILARENLAVLRQSLATAQKGYDQVEAKRRAGLASELDALSARVNLENLKPSLESALTAYESQEARFKQTLGLEQGAPISLVGSLAEASSVSALDFSGLSGEAPSVAALRASLESARVQEAAARSATRSPSLVLSGSYGPQSVNSGPWTDNGSLSATLSFSLDNLMPWSSARETADKARDTTVKTESQLKEALTGAEISVRSLRRSIEQSLASLAARRLTVEMAERSWRLTEEAYNFGTKDILSLQKAGDNLQEARANLLKEAYNLVSALLDLEYALGLPFGTLGR
ncbi:MAG TPA: TolC family protein [Spirochaetia bacterium]|nr:TolC family protein [Spirochaetales bacterium]HRY79165.1 TolC family protein [Spirochaetia bacterium]HRZ88128.1 TolC family protein [Spirochaetia bacterium]